MFKRFNYFFSNLLPSFIGIYIIFNSYHQIAYIGMTTNLGARLAKHRNDLEADRHDCSLLQKHFNELKNDEKLDPFQYLFSYTILQRSVNYVFDEETHQKLLHLLKNVEKACIQFFINRQIPLYNVDGTDPSLDNQENSLMQQKETTAKNWLYNPIPSLKKSSNIQSTYEKLFENLPKNANKPVKVLKDDLGVFPTTRDAAEALNMDYRHLEIALKNKNNRFQKLYHYISEDEYLKENKKSSNLLTKKSFQICKCIRVLDPDSPHFGQVFYGIGNYASKINLNRNYFYQKMKSANFAKNYQIISFEEFLLDSPPIDTLIENNSKKEFALLGVIRSRCVYAVGVGIFTSIEKAANELKMDATTLNRYLISKKNIDKYYFITMREYQIILQSQAILSRFKDTNNDSII